MVTAWPEDWVVAGTSLAGPLDGSEPVLIDQDGFMKHTTTQDIADLGGGGDTLWVLDADILKPNPVTVTPFNEFLVPTDGGGQLRLDNDSLAADFDDGGGDLAHFEIGQTGLDIFESFSGVYPYRIQADPTGSTIDLDVASTPASASLGLDGNAGKFDVDADDGTNIASISGNDTTGLLELLGGVDVELQGVAVDPSGGSDSDILQQVSGRFVPVGIISSGFYHPAMFGDGSDGAATISGTTVLTRDHYYTTLVVQNGGILSTNGYRVFALQSITVDSGGTIRSNGGNGANNTTGGGSSSHGSLNNNGSTAGGNGGTSASGFGGSTPSGSLGGAGGNGAAAGFGGSVGGVPFPPAATSGGAHDLLVGIQGVLLGAGSITSIAGGGGGGGGDKQGAVNGAGGGGGGGVVLLVSPTITNNGAIQANGGNGGTPGGSAGGGGGGGGGVVFYTCVTFSGNTPTAAGGTKGTGGTGGTNGSAGTVLLFQV